MGSRIRANEKLFEVIVEVARIDDYDGEDGEDDVTSTSSFSQSIESSFSFIHPSNTDQELLKSIQKFVFPFHPSFKSPTVDHFTFVLTDIDGKFKFGFCRLSADSKLCHCVVSCHPWYEIFYRLLNQFADLKNSHEVAYMNEWIDSILGISYADSKDPVSNKELTSTAVFVFQVPDPTKLMSIPQSRNLTEYYCAVDSKNMMQIFASMLFERRIIITSRKLSRLTSCVQTAATLLFPFHWQHIFIPILPAHLLDFCSAPMPFLIGVHTSLWNQINKEDLSDVLILDADDNNIISTFNDLNHIPVDVVTKLKKYLKVKNKMKNLDGDIIPHAFLKVLVILFGGYRSAFKMNEDKEIVFDSTLFLQSRPENMRTFLKLALQSQIFQQFIDERLMLIKAKRGYNDIFETEISIYDTKYQKYKQTHKAIEGLMNYTKKIIKFPLDLDSCGTAKSCQQKQQKFPTRAAKQQPPPNKSPRKMSAQSTSPYSPEKSNLPLVASYGDLSSASSSLSSPLRGDQMIGDHVSHNAITSLADGDDISSYSNMLVSSRDDLTFSFNALDIHSSDDHPSKSPTSITKQPSIRSPSLTQLNNKHEYDVPTNWTKHILNSSKGSNDDNITKCSDNNVDDLKLTMTTNSNTKVDASASNSEEPSNKPSTTEHRARVQQLVKKFEDPQNKMLQNKSATMGSKQQSTNKILSLAYPGTHFTVKPLHPNMDGSDTSSTNNISKHQEFINNRRRELMESTDQWKKRYRMMNVSDIPPNLTHISKRMDELKNKTNKENNGLGIKIINNVNKNNTNANNDGNNNSHAKSINTSCNSNGDVKKVVNNKNKSSTISTKTTITILPSTTSPATTTTSSSSSSTTTTTTTTMATTTTTSTTVIILPLIQSRLHKTNPTMSTTSTCITHTDDNKFNSNLKNKNYCNTVTTTVNIATTTTAATTTSSTTTTTASVISSFTPITTNNSLNITNNNTPTPSGTSPVTNQSLTNRVSSLARREAFKKSSNNSSSTESQRSSINRILPNQLSIKSNIDDDDDDDDFVMVSSNDVKVNIPLCDDVSSTSNRSIMRERIKDDCEREQLNKTHPTRLKGRIFPVDDHDSGCFSNNSIIGSPPPPLPTSSPPSSPPRHLGEDDYYNDKVEGYRESISVQNSSNNFEKVSNDSNNNKLYSKSKFNLPIIMSKNSKIDDMNDNSKHDNSENKKKSLTICIGDMNNKKPSEMMLLLKRDDDDTNYRLSAASTSSSHSSFHTPESDPNFTFTLTKNGVYVPLGFKK